MNKVVTGLAFTIGAVSGAAGAYELFESSATTHNFAMQKQYVEACKEGAIPIKSASGVMDCAGVELEVINQEPVKPGRIEIDWAATEKRIHKEEVRSNAIESITIGWGAGTGGILLGAVPLVAESEKRRALLRTRASKDVQQSA